MEKKDDGRGTGEDVEGRGQEGESKGRGEEGRVLRMMAARETRERRGVLALGLLLSLIVALSLSLWSVCGHAQIMCVSFKPPSV